MDMRCHNVIQCHVQAPLSAKSPLKSCYTVVATCRNTQFVFLDSLVLLRRCFFNWNHYSDICEDEKQLMYTRCSYIYPSNNQCTNPIPRHLDPPLCGGHCDSVDPPELEPATDSNTGKQSDDLELASTDSKRVRR